MNKVVIAVLLVAAAAAGFFLQQKQQPAPALAPTPTSHSNHTPAPKPAPPSGERIAFTLPDLEGNPRSLSEWDGKARLVNFWATWCAPCRREIPLLKKTQAEHAENLQVIGIAVDFKDDVMAYAEEAEFNYPILVGQEKAMAAAEKSGVNFVGLPFTMIVSAQGELIKTHIGEILPQHIEKIVDVLDQLREGDLNLAAAREQLGTF